MLISYKTRSVSYVEPAEVDREGYLVVLVAAARYKVLL